ncbi:unnamed protein product [Rotaria magnacalcarata]|uniref:Cysteine dioxygenase n=2 Tax=Rotaria magnacalcarata TaxID=392030 RepID=A0A815QXX6_9BILA|nr:unnamed protein product [Rotaria magnacalcarata]
MSNSISNMEERPVTIVNKNIPDNLSFVFLDDSVTEYVNFKDRFCKQINCTANLWSRCNNVEEFKIFFSRIVLPSKIVLITTGSRCSDAIKDISHLDELHSVYIYCRSISKYEPLKKQYPKISGVFDISDTLLMHLRNCLEEEMIHVPDRMRPNPLPLTLAERAKEAATPPKYNRIAEEPDVEYFAQPGIHWCPWNSNNCSKNLLVRGQGSVIVMEFEAMPFELRLSNRSDPSDTEAFSIILVVDPTEARLGTNNRTYDSSTVPHHVLQPNNGQWRQYWISYSKETHTVQYGIGEMRSLFTIFRIILDEMDHQSMKDVYYLHIKLNGTDQMLKDHAASRENFRFFVGKEVVYDPALVIVPENTLTLIDRISHRAIEPSHLEVPCRKLYRSILNFELNESDFPDFSRAIDRSVRSPDGWCHTKLIEKANRFGRPNFHATYLRITIGHRDGSAPGHAFVVEAWPPGHYSPVHSHSNAYGIIKVLSGRILVKIYPELALNVRQHSPIETILEQGQVTWMLPKLNQIHQVRNPDIYGNTSVTIQCYQYGQEDQEHYEYFDYLNNDGLAIDHFDPTSDIDFFEFKRLMQNEWNITAKN